MKKIKNNNYFKILLSFVMLTLGSFLAALALEAFLIPNTIRWWCYWGIYYYFET